MMCTKVSLSDATSWCFKFDRQQDVPYLHARWFRSLSSCLSLYAWRLSSAIKSPWFCCLFVFDWGQLANRANQFRQPSSISLTQAKWFFSSSVFMLYVAWKRGVFRKCARFVLFCPIKKRALQSLVCFGTEQNLIHPLTLPGVVISHPCPSSLGEFISRRLVMFSFILYCILNSYIMNTFLFTPVSWCFEPSPVFESWRSTWHGSQGVRTFTVLTLPDPCYTYWKSTGNPTS